MSYKSSVKFKFYKEYFFIAFPIMLQQFFVILLNIIDNIMVGKLGEEAIVAVGSSNKMVFILMLALFGANGGASILMAQYFGKKSYSSLQKIFFLAMVISITIGLTFTLTSYFFAYEFISFFTKDETIRLLGQDFLKISTISFPFFAISMASTIGLRSTGNTRLPLYVTIFATLTNTFLNYCLIFGNFGFPELGVNGAAIATLIARFAEAICCFVVLANKKYHLRASLKTYLTIPKKMLKTFTKIATPAFALEFFRSMGMTILYGAYALLGTKATTAVIISEVLMSIASIVFLSASGGAAIIIGQKIGANQMQKALWTSNQVLKISIALAFVVFIVCLLAIFPILSFYSLEAETKTLTILTLMVVSLAVFLRVITGCMMLGVLRAGGDTFVLFLIDFLPTVLFAIPMAFLLPKFFTMPIYILMLVVNAEVIFKLYIVIKRFKSKKWIKNLVN